MNGALGCGAVPEPDVPDAGELHKDRFSPLWDTALKGQSPIKLGMLSSRNPHFQCFFENLYKK